jgi:hypothetical protein
MDGTIFVGPTMNAAVDVVGGGAALPGGTSGLFHATATSVTGAAIGTTSAPALYNPPGNTKLARVIAVNLGDISGTLIRANLRYYWAAQPTLSGLTQGTIMSRSRGVGATCIFYTGLTVGAAATIFVPSGIGSGGAIGAQFNFLSDKCMGIYDVQPGELFYPFVSNAAWAGVTDVGLIWVETPIPTGN